MFETRYASSNEEYIKFDTTKLRDEFHIGGLFKENEIRLVYSHYDRIIIGSIYPVDKELELKASKELGVNYFLERRELGIINIGGEGIIEIDGKEYNILPRDGIYIGSKNKELKFKSKDKNTPAKFYTISTPAHQSYPIVQIKFQDAKPNKLGSDEELNKRTIYQYVHPAVCQSCQLVMGMTILEEGSVWNTMPCHTHDRRMEVYFYFDMKDDATVFHLLGKPNETRHIVMRNEEATISPSWSIHSGVGTKRYTFIWAMAGENQEFTDMDFVNMKDLF